MTSIHPTAIVDPNAKVAPSVSIGPYSVVGPHVTLGENVRLESHVVVTGHTELGADSRIFPFASVGHEPQDLKFHGEESKLVIGTNATIREHVTLNPGTEGGGLITTVGDHCLFMMGAHVAHDCRIGDHVIFVNGATVAGHVEVGDWAIIGGLSAVHQFARIGRHAMIGGMSGVENDVIPYGSVVGNRAHLSGLNLVGLKRRGFSRDDIHDLRRAYRLIFAQEGTQSERLADVAELFPHIEPVTEILDFMGAESSRAICQPIFEDAA